MDKSNAYDLLLRTCTVWGAFALNAVESRLKSTLVHFPENQRIFQEFENETRHRPEPAQS
jgi:hypothetical protein